MAGMENCPYCGKPFKRLKSHLPHCKMAGDVKISPVAEVQTQALIMESRTVTVHSSEKKKTKDLTLRTKTTSNGEKKKRKSDKLQPLQEVHRAGSEIAEGIGTPKQAKYKKGQTDEMMQVMTQKMTKSLTDTTKGVLEVKHVKNTTKLYKSKDEVISSQADLLPSSSTLVVNEGKSPMKNWLIQGPAQDAVKPREVRLKSPNQESGTEQLAVSINDLQNFPWNQNHKDKMASGQQSQMAPSSLDEYTKLEYGRDSSASASCRERKESNLEPWIEDRCQNLPGKVKQWEDGKKENNGAKGFFRNEKQAEDLGDAGFKNNGTEKKQLEKVMAALIEDEHLPSHANCIAVSAKAVPDFATTQPSLLTSKMEDRVGIYATHVKNAQDCSESVLKKCEKLKGYEERSVKQCLGFTWNDKNTYALLSSGSKTTCSGSLGLQYFPEFYTSYLRLHIVSERPFCQNKITSERWQAWDRLCNRFLGMKKVGLRGWTMLVAGCCFLSCAWQYELIRLDHWRKDP